MDSRAGRILIVDDNAALLKVMDAYLTRLGFRVDACRGAGEAWALVQAAPSAYTGALVDLNMPGMRGEELVRKLLDSNASMRLVVVSGDAAGLSGMEALDEHRIVFLPKPFAPMELADALSGTQ